METRVLDSELPLEQNFYEHGENICKAKELSFIKIDFYNVKPAQRILSLKFYEKLS